MSDTGKTILWIVVALVVIAVVIWLFASARRSKEADARRFEASELRAQVQDRLPQVQNHEDRASVTTKMAAEARAEADEKAAAARNLEAQAEQHRATAEAAHAEHEDLARRADLVDPDVPTDSEGYLVDDTGHRYAGQGPSSERRSDEQAEQAEQAGPAREATSPEPGPRAATLGAGAGAVAAGSLAAAFAHDDDEEDLADAENPFAATASAEPGEHDVQPSEQAAAAEPEEPGDVGEQDKQDVTTGEEPGDVSEQEEPAAAAERDELSDVGEQDEQDEKPPSTESDAASTEPAEPNLETTSPAVAVAEAVPALQDRDTHVALGGTPASDPGDHRGQPWATTPGAPGLEEDAGQSVEGSGGQDDEKAPQPAGEKEGAEGPSGRRISTFEEVADGGYGIGSAAPLADGAQPLGHDIKGTREGRSFLAPTDDGYDDVEPDVWFYNEEAARRAGFSREGE